MGRWKKWFALWGLSGASVVVPSCSTLWIQGIRDAALDGTFIFVSELTQALLEEFIVIDGSQGT